MTHGNSKLVGEIMEVLTLSGVEGGLAGSIQLLLNEAMKVERGAYLQAEPYERSEFRQDQSNGFKPKSLTTRMGELSLLVPQTRNGGFYPSMIEKGLRSERALFAAIAEMYVQGVSTRRVTAILEKLCGCEISSSQVSRICKRLDEELDLWRNRKLGSFAYLIADARYEKVRFAGSVRDLAILWAIGVTHDGRREILGVSVSLSEAEVHWRDFFKGLLERGLHGLTYIVSDDHVGLKAARTAVFPGVPWNRCHTHLAHNAQGYVSKQDRKGIIAQEVRDILQAPDLASAKQLLDRFLKTWQSKEPRLVSWAEANIPEGFAVFQIRRNLRRHFRTSNLIERMNQELKRRSRVVRIFPNEDSCLRLLSAVLLEIHEDWSSSERRLFLTQEF